MPEDSKPNVPIEIIIRVDPSAATKAVKRAAQTSSSFMANQTRSLLQLPIVRFLLFVAAAGITTFLVSIPIALLKAPGYLSASRYDEVVFEYATARAIVIVGIIVLALGLLALKRRYSPLIRD